MGRSEETAERDSSALPSIDKVLMDESVSHWLHRSLRSALSRDPVDAAKDAALLAELLERRAQEAMEASMQALGMGAPVR